MKKQIGFTLSIVIFIVGTVFLYWLFGNWTIWYRSEFNHFFGEGNWDVISEDTEYSQFHLTRNASSRDSYGETKRGRFYRDWNILYRNQVGEEKVWEITNHTYRLNHERYKILSPKRFTARQALIQELMNISFAVIEEEVHDEIIKEGLTEEEAHCIYVNMSYHDGNPPRSFYNKLAKEDWFTINGVTAENYLASDLYDFYLLIRIHDYRLEALSGQEQENVVNSLANIEKRLLETYGENASFEILYDDYKSEYADGAKQ